MRVIFMGTSSFAVPTLEALRESVEIVAVVTQPDRPSGRGLHVIESPVKQASVGLPILQPERVRAQEFIDELAAIGPLDTIVVAAFGQIIPKAILDMPRLGSINVHASLLPKYRGAAPIQRAVLNAETRTGVTTMLMDPGLDTGPILLREETEIGSEETGGELTTRLAEIGARLLLRTLDELERGTIRPIPQDDSEATLAPSIKKEEAIIDWNQPADAVVNKVRAFAPRPGAYALLERSIVKIWRAEALKDHAGEPGIVLKTADEGITIAASAGAVLLKEVQPENRKRMAAAEFARGARVRPGMRFDQR